MSADGPAKAPAAPRLRLPLLGTSTRPFPNDDVRRYYHHLAYTQVEKLLAADRAMIEANDTNELDELDELELSELGEATADRHQRLHDIVALVAVGLWEDQPF